MSAAPSRMRRKLAHSDTAKLDGGKVGSFDGDTGDFFSREIISGKAVMVNFHWHKRDPDRPVYSAAFSADAGITWEHNWYAHFARVTAG